MKPIADDRTGSPPTLRTSSSAGARPTCNRAVAERLREAADLLDLTKAEIFRAAAYRKAADSVAHLGRDVREIAQGGPNALEAIPGVGRSISRAIKQLLETGRWPYLEQLRGSADPVQLLRTLPGIGPVLARRIFDTLHVSTLEQLEAAAELGRLDEVAGLGPRRAKMLRAELEAVLSRIRRPDQRSDQEPPVTVLLDVDRQYRDQLDDLPRIAPRRFNPGGAAWLPVLHTRRADWTFTALYSNSGRAHELGKQRDWVVISFSSRRGPEGQRTVVTETHGALAGRRVVRGREQECLSCFPDHDIAPARLPGQPSPPPYGPPPLEIEPTPQRRLGPHSPDSVEGSRSAR
ncbi:helix-hairpin-helix domain-containing protein [Methylobacterium sp. NEAU K]|uniref:helix-hairpin-helix domain-containing protein n=1 Tax=Methylobacterium sp. NEAU K TaxID=3064946 RepID=UPI0027347E8D|nr:helix-hairpin-helix domain-containing protein [Methylobacterium sp. NEAU K]MDP4006217.1 helix-hairpin-helix domain-containing protein [Methylobacterium sp. NEAU K]